jgi:hypothetical protein
MTGPRRPLKLPDRRLNITDKMTWPENAARARRIHICVGFDPREIVTPALHPPIPREVFLRGGGQTGSFIDMELDDIGELLSLALQHGHSADELEKRFKPGSLAWTIIRKVRQITAEEFGPAPVEA